MTCNKILRHWNLSLAKCALIYPILGPFLSCTFGRVFFNLVLWVCLWRVWSVGCADDGIGIGIADDKEEGDVEANSP